MSQPEDSKDDSEPSHQKGVDVSTARAVIDETCNGKRGNHADYGQCARRNDRPPIIRGSEVEEEEWQCHCKEEHRAEVGSHFTEGEPAWVQCSAHQTHKQRSTPRYESGC